MARRYRLGGGAKSRGFGGVFAVIKAEFTGNLLTMEETQRVFENYLIKRSVFMRKDVYEVFDAVSL